MNSIRSFPSFDQNRGSRSNKKTRCDVSIVKLNQRCESSFIGTNMNLITRKWNCLFTVAGPPIDIFHFIIVLFGFLSRLADFSNRLSVYFEETNALFCNEM